jgi:hypothetical protein
MLDGSYEERLVCTWLYCIVCLPCSDSMVLGYIDTLGLAALFLRRLIIVVSK